MKRSLLAWIDNNAVTAAAGATAPAAAAARGGREIDWVRVVPYLALHMGVLGVFVVGFSRIALVTAALLYAVRMFAITAFYHRYFSHRSFKTSRVAQFLFALLGTSAVQRGPLWWAAHHRQHHAHSDQPDDPHSPGLRGFLWAHTGWFLATCNFSTRQDLVRDLRKFPELCFLDRFDVVVPIALGAALFALGSVLGRYHPGLHTSGSQLLVWGLCVSTVLLYHATFSVNSLAHGIGSRRYATHDDSRNNWAVAVLTLGEGWHNNHHYYPNSARQGFFWWELDPTFYVLRALRALGLIWDLRVVPVTMRDRTSRP